MENKNYHQLFKDIIVNPDRADNDVVVKLADQYPYLNALWFIQARLAIVHQDKNVDFAIQKAALYFSDADQLAYFLYKPNRRGEEKSSEQEETIQAKENDYIEDIYLDDEVPASETRNIPNAPPHGNQTNEDGEIEKTDRKPSRYNDDLMPYTFLWWLQKTRSEYSGTYQPYSTYDRNPQTANEVTPSTEDPLDQQIRENIFHLQSPEQKLSSPFGGETIPFQVEKKENPIIERFIKEEPHIKPPSAEKISLENKARKSAEDDSGFVSETLALIYAEQGLYHKAIETYRKLSLKFPEKSPYFASRINDLTNKIN